MMKNIFKWIIFSSMKLVFKDIRFMFLNSNKIEVVDVGAEPFTNKLIISNKVKNLWVIFDHDMSFKSHIKGPGLRNILSEWCWETSWSFRYLKSELLKLFTGSPKYLVKGLQLVQTLQQEFWWKF